MIWQCTNLTWQGVTGLSKLDLWQWGRHAVSPWCAHRNGVHSPYFSIPLSLAFGSFLDACLPLVNLQHRHLHASISIESHFPNFPSKSSPSNLPSRNSYVNQVLQAWIVLLTYFDASPMNCTFSLSKSHKYNACGNNQWIKTTQSGESSIN